MAMRLWTTSADDIRRRLSPHSLHGLLAAGVHRGARLPPRHAAQDYRCQHKTDDSPRPEHTDGLQLTPGVSYLYSRELARHQGGAHPEPQPVDREDLSDPLQPLGEVGDRVEDAGQGDQP